MKKSTIAIVVLSAAFVMLLFRSCFPEMDWLVRPDDPNRSAIWEGYAVASGVFLYTEKNSGRLPRSLNELKPDFVGSAIDLSHYTLHRPGATGWNKYDDIVSRRIMTPAGERWLYVYGSGYVSVVEPSAGSSD